MVNNYLDPVFHNHEQIPRERPPASIQGIPPGMPRPPFPQKPPPPIKGWPLFNFMLTASLISGLSLGFRFSEKLAFNEKLRKEAEKEKLNTELTFLKHQINPHFLFNTLNSIYSLALVKSDMTAEAVMKLSEMMRYVLQDVEKEKVPLALEIEYLEHYVELQKIRLSENVEVQFAIKGEPDAFEIPPIILVPFVENAFKFGTSAHENARITISIRIAENQLAFQVSNQIFNGRKQTETFGIGIQNTRKRLQLIYPGKHRLDLTKTESHFNVTLMIVLT
jgi:sensor histidine kinase YesM